MTEELCTFCKHERSEHDEEENICEHQEKDLLENIRKVPINTVCVCIGFNGLLRKG